MTSQILVNIDLDIGLLPQDTKPIPEPLLTIHKWGLVIFKIYIPDASLKITDLIL